MVLYSSEITITGCLTHTHFKRNFHLNAISPIVTGLVFIADDDVASVSNLPQIIGCGTHRYKRQFMLRMSEPPPPVIRYFPRAGCYLTDTRVTRDAHFTTLSTTIVSTAPREPRFWAEMTTWREFSRGKSFFKSSI